MSFKFPHQLGNILQVSFAEIIYLKSTKPYCNFHDRPQGVGLHLTKGEEQRWQKLGKGMGELGRAEVGFYTLPHRAGSLATRCQI